MNATKISPETCYFIAASTLGEMSDNAAQAIDCFFNSDLDVSFGDANRTLISIDRFFDALQGAMDADGIFYNDDGTIHSGYEQIKNALDEFDSSVYIDLEN